jgi:hypothetical protein
MTTATISAAQFMRLNIQLDTTPGLPKLPHIPENWNVKLTPQQQEENLLHVALWIVERDQENFNMDYWHGSWANAWANWPLPTFDEAGYNECGTVHCIAGFAQVMAGVQGFTTYAGDAGHALLGYEAQCHFMDTNEDGLEFLKEVIARNS